MTKSGEVLVVDAEEGKTEVPIGDVSELVLHGPVGLTTPALAALLREEIPITYASSGGWILGHTVSTDTTTSPSALRSIAPPSTSGVVSLSRAPW